ncbi:MAG: hypothetical protein Q9169_004881 [Polycauliona sp. 2 TL-2023]
MDQCFSAPEDGRWSNAEDERSLPLRVERLSFCQEYNGEGMWTQQADTGGHHLLPFQQAHDKLDASGEMFAGEGSQQLAWSSASQLVAQSESHTQPTSQRPAVPPSESRPSPPISHGNDNEEDDLSTESGEDDGQNPNDTPKTAAERRAEKRKMKRFRLTHNQTRFLMSEFARQAHPDASQRERLSREIPGLSPRQVQVWFQNRRAKLKRLTIDDQESMLKSRALPAGFNNAQAFNNAYDAPRHGSDGGPSSFFDSSHPESEMRRSLITGGLGLAQDHDDNISPTSVVSNFVDASFPASETISPISPISDRSHFYTPPTSQGTSPRVSASFTRSSSFPTVHPTPRRRHGSPLQQRLVRSRAGSSAFPTSHATKAIEQNMYHPIVSPHADQPHPYSHQTITASSDSDYSFSHATPPIEEGLGASGTAWPNLNINENRYPPSHTVGMAGHRTYGSLGAPAQVQHHRPVRQVQSAPLAAPPEFYLPGWTTQYPAGEACFPNPPAYGQVATADQVWLPYHHQAQHPQYHHVHAQAAMESRYNQGSATPRPGNIEGWPE